MISRVIRAFGLFIGISSLMALGAGCQELGLTKDKNNDASAVLPPRTAPSHGVRWLLPEDTECLAGNSSHDISTVTIYKWNGSTIEPTRVELDGAGDEDGAFGTSNVRGSILEYSINYDCKVKFGDLSCVNNNSASNKNILTLKVCRADAVYSRDSLEAMTLTSHYFTENAYKFYDSIAGRKSGILPAVLLTQPKFKRHVTKDDGTTLDRFDVDNAAFAELDSTDLNKFGLFIIFPTSTKSFDESGLNLWEVPFVMRHEFGHHVFAHYLGNAVKSVGLKLNDSMSIDSILPGPTRHRSRHTASFSLTAVTSAQFAVNGINETYADLFAYFAGDAAKDQLKGIKCLDAVRDPSRATYVDGSKKGIDENSIDIYEGRAFAAEKKDCAKPTFDDEHDIAAALGQPLAAFIETSYPGLTGAQRAEVLLNWAQKLDPLFRGSERDIRIDNIVKELVLAVKEKNGLKKDACDNLKPAITGLPLATAACDP